MQRIQQVLSVIVLAVLLSACQKNDGTTQTANQERSVADYVHDVDLAKNLRDEFAKDPVKNKDNKEYITVSVAVEKALHELRECFPDKVSTATTDHACIDRHGYKR